MNFRSRAFAAIGRQQSALIRHIHPPVRPADDPLSGHIKAEFGFVPAPVILHDSVDGLFAGSWMLLRETVMTGTVPRAEKECLSLAISKENRCPFCVESHGMTLAALRSTGNAKFPKVMERSPAETAEIIGTAVLFHYLNRVVNVFLDESPLPPLLRLRPWRSVWLRVGGWTFTPIATQQLVPGESLAFLPEVPLARDLSWAEPQPFVAGAFARFADAIEKAARNALPPGTRELVHRQITSSTIAPAGNTDAWTSDATSGLPAPERPLAILALLAAFASYRVSPQHIESARAEGADDAVIVATVAWSAFVIAKELGIRSAA